MKRTFGILLVMGLTIAAGFVNIGFGILVMLISCEALNTQNKL